MNNRQASNPAWVQVKPAGYVRVDTVVAIDRSKNEYRLRTADGTWHFTRRAELDRLLGKG